MSNQYIIEPCPKCSNKLRVEPRGGFGLTPFLICDDCNIFIRFNNKYEISDLERFDSDDIAFVKNKVNCYCCFYSKPIIHLSDFEYNSLQELYNKLLKIKDLMIFN